MLTIMVPCLPLNPKDVEATVRLLEKEVGEKHPKGIEIVGSANLFLDPETSSRSIANLERLCPKDCLFSVHFPFGFGNKGLGRNLCPSPLNLAFPNRKILQNVLNAVISFSDEIGAEILNIHAGTHISWRQRNSIETRGALPERRRIILQRVKSRLEDIQRVGGIQRKICLENVPPNWSETRSADPRLNSYEICFVELADFLLVANPSKNVFATVDTARLGGTLDSSQIPGAIKSLGNALGHIHFSDFAARFQPFRSAFEDALVPVDGGIGEKVFRELLQYFAEYSKTHDLAINIEVRSKNYTELEELRESVKRVMRWLEEIN